MKHKYYSALNTEDPSGLVLGEERSITAHQYRWTKGDYRGYYYRGLYLRCYPWGYLVSAAANPVD